MPVAHEFCYKKPADLSDALELMAKHGEKAVVLAGGTDLAVHIKEDHITPDMVVDIKGIKDLGKLEIKEDTLFIGALVTFTDLIDNPTVSKEFKVLSEASSTVASVGIRNRATLVGNLCSAVPSLDCGPTLLVYDADVIAKSKKGERKIPVTKFFTGPKRTDVKADEIVTGVEMKKPAKKHASVYVKLGRYAGEDLAQAGVTVMALEGNEYRVAFCALGPVARRSEKIESYLSGKELTEDVLDKAAEMAKEDVSPITDIRASREYRLHMAGEMLKRGLKAAKDRLNGKDVPALGLLGGE